PNFKSAFRIGRHDELLKVASFIFRDMRMEFQPFVAMPDRATGEDLREDRRQGRLRRRNRRRSWIAELSAGHIASDSRRRRDASPQAEFRYAATGVICIDAEHRGR